MTSIQHILLLALFHVTSSNQSPNILVFIADDLGIGDIGCYGNNSIRTPNIDRLCTEGVKLAHHIAAAPLCSPSRAAFFTGRYPVRYGMSRDDGSSPVPTHAMGRAGIPRNETTWMNVLMNRGYRTHVTGKWHLGFDCDDWWRPCQGLKRYGVQSFYGLPLTLMDQCENNLPFFRLPNQALFWSGLPTCLCIALLTVWFLPGYVRSVLIFTVAFILVLWFLTTHAILTGSGWWNFSNFLHKRFNCILTRNNTVVEQPLRLEGLSQRLSLESRKFLQAQKLGQPFALVHSFAHVHSPMFTHPHFQGISVHGRYGDNVEEMDWVVGTILDELQKTGLDSNTIVYFFSDHGGHIELRDEEGKAIGGYNGIYKGSKGSILEGGIRIPGIIRWPLYIRPGTEITAVTSLMDFFPTIHEVLNIPLPSDRKMDGRSIYSLLQKKSSQSPHMSLFHFCGILLQAATLPTTNGVFKLYNSVPKFKSGTRECITPLCQCFEPFIETVGGPWMYNLSGDPSEQINLSLDKEPYKSISQMIQSVSKTFLSENYLPPTQYNSMFKIYALPWQMACCNFPLCSCIDEMNPYNPDSVNIEKS